MKGTAIKRQRRRGWRVISAIAACALISACQPRRVVTIPTLDTLPTLTPSSAAPPEIAPPPTETATAMTFLQPTYAETPIPITPTVEFGITEALTPSRLPAPTVLPTLVPAALYTPVAALLGTMNAANSEPIIVYAAPDFMAASVAVYDAQQFALITGRSVDSAWYEVFLPYENVRGWVQGSIVFAQSDLRVLPVMPPPPYATIVVMVAPASDTPLSTTTAAVQLGDVAAMENRLRNTPVLHHMNTERVRAIYAAGQRLGNRADAFTVIGDSNSTNGDFLQPIGAAGDYCEYTGDNQYLQETVNWFSSPMDADGGNAFTHNSITAERGFNSAAAFDPFWAGGACYANEAPLTCEYRTARPSAAIIMLGGIDINSLTPFQYYQNMLRIVEDSMGMGVIPVLTTFVVLPERDVYVKSLEFNMMLLDIADLYQIPVINLWREAQRLPNVGIASDRTHLKAEVGRYCDFRGYEWQFGGTLRNLLTLQALDTLRHEVFVR